MVVMMSDVPRDRKIITSLYQTIVHSHWEYCLQAWNPFFRKEFSAEQPRLSRDIEDQVIKERLKLWIDYFRENEYKNRTNRDLQDIDLNKLEVPHDNFSLAQNTGTRGRQKFCQKTSWEVQRALLWRQKGRQMKRIR